MFATLTVTSPTRFAATQPVARATDRVTRTDLLVLGALVAIVIAIASPAAALFGSIVVFVVGIALTALGLASRTPEPLAEAHARGLSLAAASHISLAR